MSLPVTLTVEVRLHSDRTDELVAALNEFVDRVHGLPSAGAPLFAVAAPVTAITTAETGAPNAVLVRPRERAVLRGRTPVELTRREYDLLLFLATHPRQVFSRTQLLRHVWGTVYSGERTVDVHIARLRQKLSLTLVDTVRGVGYRFDAEADVTIED